MLNIVDIGIVRSFREEYLLRYSYEKTDKPPGWAILGPRVIVFRNLKEDHPRKIHVKYCLVVSEKNTFKDFPVKKLISPRAGPF